MDLKDGWYIIRYLDKDKFVEEHRSLNYCFGEHLDLENFRDFSTVYYAICNPHNEPQALFEVKNGVNELLRYYGKEGYPPSDECIERAIPFIKKKGLGIQSSNCTGFTLQEGELYNVFNFPGSLTSVRSLIIDYGSLLFQRGLLNVWHRRTD